jgi:hypothetical protein
MFKLFLESERVLTKVYEAQNHCVYWPYLSSANARVDGKQCFGGWNCFRPQVRGQEADTCFVGSFRKTQHRSLETTEYNISFPSAHLKKETDAVCGTLRFLFIWNSWRRTKSVHYRFSEVLCSLHLILYTNKTNTLWPLVRERAIPTERQPLVDEI